MDQDSGENQDLPSDSNASTAGNNSASQGFYVNEMDQLYIQ